MFKIQTKNDLIDSYQAGVKNFERIILTAVNLTEGDFQDVILNESNLIEVNWSNCNLDRASFLKACLGLSNFRNCSLRSANFREANLQEADLTGADLTEANLINTDLRAANLQQANFKGANLQGARLENASLTEAAYDLNTTFDSDFVPQTKGMILIDCDLARSEFDREQGRIEKLWSWWCSPKFTPSKNKQD